MSSSKMRGPQGRRGPPNTVPGPRDQGMAQHLPLLLRGSIELGALGPGCRDHLWVRVCQEGGWAIVEETEGAWPGCLAGAGLNFRGSN